IDAMALDGVTLTVTAAAAQADGYFTAGYADAGGITLAIIAHVGSTITLVRRFPESSVGVGTAIALVAGCDRTSATCTAKFANLVHFLGFPRMPKDDPFQTPMV
ncbi:MAG: phage BR0599 family protein, partial [Gemmatimonadaceae bacterium]